MKKFLLAAVIVLPTLTFASSLEDLRVNTYTPSYGRVPSNAVRLPLLKLTINPQYDLEVSEIVVRREGLSDFSQFGNIWAQAGYKRSRRAALFSDDTATLSFRNPLQISANTFYPIWIYGNLEDAKPSNTFSFALQDIIFEGQASTVNTPGVERQTFTEEKTANVETAPVYIRRTDRTPRIRCVKGKCVRLR